MGSKPASIPMEANVNLWFDGNHILNVPRMYRRLIEKLIYLIVTTSDITLVVGCRVDYASAQRGSLDSCTILVYVKSSSEKGLLYEKYRHVRISGYFNCDKGENVPLDVALLLEESL